MTFKITIKSSRHTFECPRDSNILAAGLASDYMLSYNCRSGLCRMCKARVVEGHIDYIEKPLSTYLSERESAEGYALLCQARPCSDLLIEADEITNAGDVRPHRSPCRISEITRVADDIIVMRLRLPMNENVRYMPGQHVGILLDGGVERYYSIANACGPAGMTDLELHIRHVPGGLFTDALFSEIKKRALLKLELPLGTFFLRSTADRPIVMLATGTGFAPVKAIMEHVLARDIQLQRPIHLYWGGRRRSDLYMYDLARKWSQENDNIRFTPVLSQPSDACDWSGLTGYITDHAAADYPDLAGSEIYACGSPAMVRGAREALAQRCGADPALFFGDEFLTLADMAGVVSD